MIVFLNHKEMPAVRGDLLCRSKNIFVFGQNNEAYERFDLADGSVLFIWGGVYGVALPDASFVSVDLKSNGKEILEKLLIHCSLPAAIEKIEGDFLGLLIKKNGDAFLFGDTFNRKELFYTREQGSVIASTGLEAVVPAVAGLRYSQNALVNLLTVYGYYAPKKHTIYENISRLGVGERFHISGEHVALEKTPFVPLKTRPYGLQEHREYVDIMKSAVASRASAHGNWLYMSSGYDSSSILALLVEALGPARVKCVIGRMKYSERSGVINQFELDRAAKIADYYKVPLHQIDFDLTGRECIEFWKQLSPRLRAQHLYAHSAYNYFRLAQHVAEHGQKGDAVFVGAISDGNHNLGFAQFATILEHPDIGFREYSDKMACYLFGSSFLKQILEGGMDNDFVYKIMKDRAGAAAFDDDRPWSEFERKVKFLASFFHRNRRIPFYGLHNSALVTREGAGEFEKEMAETYLHPVAKVLAPETVYSCLLHLYNSYYWQGSTERSMGAGVLDFMGTTASIPFWDGRLHRFLSEMPEDWGRGLELRPTKYPLKWMLQNAVDYPLHLQTGPHSYLYDINPQFSHTSEWLFGSALKSYVGDILKNRPYEDILQASHFNLAYIHSLVDDYLAGKEFGGSRMNDLLSIAILCLIGWY